jgi:hypothetical protein
MYTKSLLAAYDKLFKNLTARLAATAFALSTAIIVVVFVLFAGSLSVGGNDWKLEVQNLRGLTSAIMAGIFITMYFVIWFILYIQYTKEAEDVYSRLREKIVGTWVASFEYNVGGQKVFTQNTPTAIFEFTINMQRKLEMKFDPKDNILFNDTDQTINHISLRHIADNKYSMVYYYINKRTLKSDWSKYIMTENGGPMRDVGKFEIEALGILTFEEPSGKDGITTMSGSWYDLNGSMRQLGMLMREVTRAEAREELRTFQVKMSDFIEMQGTSALMGDVEFTRTM